MEKKQNKLMTILSLGMIIALFLLFGQTYVLTENNNDENSIFVSGKSELKVNPDKAEISISISTIDKNPKIAQSKNKELSNKVTQELKNIGIDEKNIETRYFRLDKEYNYLTNDKGKEDIKYNAEHTIIIKTTNLELVNKIVETSIQSGANGIDSVNYILSDEKEKQVRSEALEKAILVGKQKAESMSATLNVELGDVLEINENNYYYTPFRSSLANMKMSMDSSEEMAGGNFITPGEVSVSSSVNLRFEINN